MIAGRLLKQFIAVAEELHFGRAAARLHMAQPPLSQAIQHLEELVGVRLLTRSKHFVALTPAGVAFLEESREMVSLVAAGMGVALLPAQVRSSPHPGVAYRDLSNQSEHFELDVAFAWRRDDMSAGVRSRLSLFEKRTRLR